MKQIYNLYSDKWLEEGYKAEKPWYIGENIATRLWKSKTGEIVGIGIDFLYANDVHYELDKKNWNLLAEKYLMPNKLTLAHLLKENSGNPLDTIRAFEQILEEVCDEYAKFSA